MSTIYWGLSRGGKGKRIHFGTDKEVRWPRANDPGYWEFNADCGAIICAREDQEAERSRPSPSRVTEFCRSCYRKEAWLAFERAMLAAAEKPAPRAVVEVDFNVIEESVVNGRGGWDVWMEGYSATGERATAQFCGKFGGETFRDACDRWASATLSEDDRRRFYDRDRLTFWGCRLFDNAGEARELFG